MLYVCDGACRHLAASSVALSAAHDSSGARGGLPIFSVRWTTSAATYLSCSQQHCLALGPYQPPIFISRVWLQRKCDAYLAAQQEGRWDKGIEAFRSIDNGELRVGVMGLGE